MKKLRGLMSVLVFSLALLLSTPTVFAASLNGNVEECSQPGVSNSSFCEGIQPTSNPIFGPNGILTRGATLLAIITGVISVFMMIWGGLKFVLSGGDSGKIVSARNTILFASIGIAVAVSTQAIVIFILRRL